MGILENKPPDAGAGPMNRRQVAASVVSFMATMSVTSALADGRSGRFRLSTGSVQPIGPNDRSDRQSPLIQTFLPKSKTPDTGHPVVFLFGGNGMGGVVRSEQAEQMALALNQRHIAAVIVHYPSLTDESIFRDSIIGPINAILSRSGSKESPERQLDASRIAFAGFSAGGLIATLLATKYGDFFPTAARAALNYYGPVDLRLWFAFHQARAGAAEVPENLRGSRSATEIGHSVAGPVACDQLSRRLIDKVSENIGGLIPGKLSPFSHDWLWNDDKLTDVVISTPVMGVFGRRDDNCDAVFQSRLIRRMTELTGTDHQSRFYDGPHGMGWNVCPDAMDWLVMRLGQS